MADACTFDVNVTATIFFGPEVIHHNRA